MPLLEEVFGVSSKPVRSYIERDEVDTRFREAIRSDKQIVVYGSSKQGKTALVSKYLPYDQNYLVSLTPKSTTTDIYQMILQKAGVRIEVGGKESSGSEASLGIGAKVRAMVPLFGGGEGNVDTKLTGTSGKEKEYRAVPLNLDQPQQVADLLKELGSKKWAILENFHYLTADVQRAFAYDLRAFQELGLRFVILGVWREKNRMAQFNGDLQDRIVEVPVEPWTGADFRQVAEKGAGILGVRFSEDVLLATILASFSSVGVFQELLKGVCKEAGVVQDRYPVVAINDLACLTRTVAEKARDYSARHERALEAIAAGHTSGGAKGDRPPLFLPYYLVRVILEGGFDGIAEGMHRTTIQENIRSIHHRGDDVRPSDMSNLLTGLANLQSAKRISPPIIDYDEQQRMLQVVDSTFYFFIKNADLEGVLSNLQNPLRD